MNVRKILIPAVAGLLISPVIMAADITATTVETSYSDEFLSTAVAASAVTGGDLHVALLAEYAVGDILTISLSGSALDSGTLTTITIGAIADSVVETPDDLPGKSGITLGRLSNDSSGAVYRVTGIDSTGVAAATTVGTIVVFATGNALSFDAAAVDAANTVVATYSATTDTGFALDSGGDLNEVDYITTGTQYTVTVDVPLNGVIDVEANREKFTSGATADAMDIVIDDDTTFSTESGAVDYDIVVTGDFSWVFDTDLVTDDVQFAAGVVDVGTTNGACTGIVLTATDLSFTCDDEATVTVTFDVANNDDDGTPPAAAVLPAGSFSATADVNFIGVSGGAGTIQALSGSAGAWTLNGYQVLIPYMPYGSGLGQIIYLANRGTKSGSVTVDWIDVDGSSGSLGVIGILGAGTTMKLGDLIKNALPMAQQTSGRLALTITANVPASDVQTNAQYNANGNRAFSLHEDNRPAPAHAN